MLDRIVDGEHAVLLCGDDEVEAVVPAALLPADTQPGAWLYVTRDDTGVIVSLAPAEEETAAARARIRAKLAELRRRGRRPGPGGADRC